MEMSRKGIFVSSFPPQVINLIEFIVISCLFCFQSLARPLRQFAYRQSSNKPAKVGAGLDVFDRKAKKLHRDRTARQPDVDVYQYVHEEMAYRLADRVYDIRRYFPLAVDVGCGLGHMSPHIFKVNLPSFNSALKAKFILL